MKHAIFIRTYHKDAAFLGYLLRSLRKFATGFDEVVVNCDDADRPVISPIANGFARVVTTRPLIRRGYYEQQYRKLTCDEHTMAQHITLLDSDCIVWAPITPEHFQAHGLGQILFTPHAHLGSTVPWRLPTEQFLKEPVENEFMRGMRFQIRRGTLERFRAAMHALHRRPLHETIDRTPNFSEFNALFAWAYKHEPQNYSWLHTEREPLPQHHVEQVYSGNGLTPDIRARWDRYLA